MTQRPKKSTPLLPDGATEHSACRLLQKLRAGQDVRTRKVRKLKASVRARRYENDLKLWIAVERLLPDLR